jgi:hypothetical protein
MKAFRVFLFVTACALAAAGAAWAINRLMIWAVLEALGG